MPKIFDEQERNIIRERLLEQGLRSLEQRGYRASSIEEIARQAGIAKGTFYNFFKSKEYFYFEVMTSIRDKRREELMTFFAVPENLSAERTQAFLMEYVQQKNVHHYFSADELKLIFRKIPDEQRDAQSSSVSFAAELVDKLPRLNPRCNCEVVVNYLNTIADFAVRSETLAVGSMTETLEFMTASLTRYIFREDR